MVAGHLAFASASGTLRGAHARPAASTDWYTIPAMAESLGNNEPCPDAPIFWSPAVSAPAAPSPVTAASTPSAQAP